MGKVHCYNLETGKPFELTEQGYKSLMEIPKLAKKIKRLGDLGENQSVKEYKHDVVVPDIESGTPHDDVFKRDSLATGIVETAKDFDDILEVANEHFKNKQWLLARELYTKALLIKPRHEKIMKRLDKIEEEIG